jgi:hypothetical protein
MIHSMSSKLCLTARAADSALKLVGATIGSMRGAAAEPIFSGRVLNVERSATRTGNMAYPKKEKLSTEAAVVIVGAALALFVGVFLVVSNQYGGTQEAQVAQQDTTPALPGNELPIAPLTPPAAPSATPPTDTPPITP